MMNSFYKISGISAMLLCLIAFSVHAKGDKDDKIVITASKQYVIGYYGKPDRTTLNLTVTYTNDKGRKDYEVLLEAGVKKDSFSMSSPLNQEYFQVEFNRRLNELTEKSGLVVLQGTINEIFLWVSSVNEIGYYLPVSGRLLVNQYIVVCEDATCGDYKDRMNNLYVSTSTLREKLMQEAAAIRKVTGNKDAISLLEIKPDWDYSRTREYLKSGITKTAIAKADIDSVRKAIKEVDQEYDSLKERKIYSIDKISIQIERGFIERIQVWVMNENGQKVIYENIFAIGFSSVKNFKVFEKTKLVPRIGNGSFIYLSDVFSNYDNILDNYTRDYSPADTAINNASPQTNSVLELRRENFSNLFDAKLYTDLNGIKPNSPNGLVQIELSRRFNLKTVRLPIGAFRSDYGFLSYFYLFGSYNKIESEQKYLMLRNEKVFQGEELLSPYYATGLDLRQYENFSLGGELNALLYDWPDGKLSTYLDFGLRYGHTPVYYLIKDPLSSPSDSISLSAHSSAWYPKVSVELFPEKRIGLIVSYQFNSVRIHSNNHFKPVMSYAKSDLLERILEPAARRHHVIECYLRAETSANKNGRVFFRARYFVQHKDINTFFSQVQLGYSHNLFFRK